MTTLRDELVIALRMLGGPRRLQEIYHQIKISTQRNLSANWEANIRGELEDSSSDSERWKKRHDIFYKLNPNVRDGIWGLREQLKPTPVPFDIVDQSPTRVQVEVYRILRDTDQARKIKELHEHCCQLCGTQIELESGQFYSEAHHIKPLGGKHAGPDIPENILVLCPNHHVMCDYGSIRLDSSQLRTRWGHQVAFRFIDYHNQKLWKSPTLNHN